MVSSPIWNSVIDLSRTSFHQLHPQKPPGEGTKTFLRRPDSNMQVDITHLGLISVIDQVKDCISNISNMSDTERQCDDDLMRALSSHSVGRDINSAIYWLFFRLGMNSETT
jgi:hypothetical protein